MQTPLIAGNWKMHKTLAQARDLVKGIRDAVDGTGGGAPITAAEVLVCPPFHLLFPMAKALAGSRVMLGAQNAHFEPQGAFTGEIAVPMVKETGCTHVIIGHSERRQHFGETGPLLAKKVRAVVAAELTVIYCVGETLDEREGGKTYSVIERQLGEVLAKDVPAERLLVAYEPVWAIGTGRNATPGQAQEVHSLIRSRLSAIYDGRTAGTIRILYGGSVKPGNAADLMSQPGVGGALVGGACLEAADFAAIIRAAVGARSQAR
ncbi:MAG: triose-phosphate isomerase [Planctomycetes bacterium]|nr:triose-phosphate isomerase [Planctomycetota bacterium]